MAPEGTFPGRPTMKRPLDGEELAQYRSLLAQACWPVNRVGSPDEEVSLSSRAALAASSALGWESTANEDARARRAGPPRTPPLLQAAAPSDDATCGTMASESAPSEAWARSGEASPWRGAADIVRSSSMPALKANTAEATEAPSCAQDINRAPSLRPCKTC